MKVKDNCVGCGQCASFCRKGAIEVMGKARATDACIECGACAPYCPVGAIQVQVPSPELEGQGFPAEAL